uniref:hypothetical protein n=1 Tax=Robertkochia flava TaxID=3447986 RepID=UPI001CCA416F
MKKLLLLLTFLFVSAISYSQVIVTLEDQCNCEILSGTDITAAGQSTPPGVEVGDIYVNTGSGTLFFWDGDSWELTSGVNPAIQDFSFNAATGELTLTLVGGSTSTADISSLIGTDDQALSLSGNTLILEDGGTVDLTPYLDNTDDQQITAFSMDAATNILTLTLEDGGTQTVDLSAYLDNTDAQTIALDNTTNILTLGNGTGADTTVDLSGYVSTDDQNLTSATIDASNILTIAIENGDPVTVDLSAYLDNTDEQDLTGASIDASNILTIAIENGAPVTVDLSAY